MCNQECLHCLNPIILRNKIEKETTEKEIYEKIKNAAKKSDEICITGEGEPTMHKGLATFIEYAKSIGIKRVGLHTNGMLFYYKEYVNKLKESGLDFCSVTLFSHKDYAKSF